MLKHNGKYFLECNLPFVRFHLLIILLQGMILDSLAVTL